MLYLKVDTIHCSFASLACHAAAIVPRAPGSILSREGRTWFGRNWHALLESQQYHTVYLDAFENDFVDDPFLMNCQWSDHQILG